MSDCGVCVGFNDGSDCTMYRCVIVKRAGKNWQCSECGKDIPKGTSYEYASWLNDGSYGNAKTCLLCAEIADAFQCNGRYHAERFWEDMWDAYDALTTACFNRLRTVEAKMELQRRWQEWKFSDSNRREVKRRAAAMIERALADGRKRSMT